MARPAASEALPQTVCFVNSPVYNLERVHVRIKFHVRAHAVRFARVTEMTEPRSVPRRRADLREAIENDIVMGRLLPGDRLDEVTLANRFEVSRTPVREALAELAASGLIEIRPHRGAFVRRLDVMELVEMFEVMAELEATCGRLAAQRLTAEDRAALEATHEACRRAQEADDGEAYYPANTAFHDAIYRATHNGHLFEHVRRMRDRLQPYRRLQLRANQRLRNSFAEHEAILAAILSGNSAEADARLRAHVQVQGTRFGDFVASVRTLGQAPAA